MDKAGIKEILASFPCPRGDWWVAAGAAMVLYGIRERTHDIDLGCSKKLADRLEADGYLYRHTESGGRWFKYGEHIEIFEGWLKDTVTDVEGFPVVSPAGLLEMKRELGREKDLKDIRLIEGFLKEHARSRGR